MSSAPDIRFTVSVDVSKSQPAYTIYDDKGVITTKAVSITVPGTTITYTLRPDSNQLQFIAPKIGGDPNHDITSTISADGQTLTLTDTDGDQEDICVRLVTVPSEAVYVSLDPQVKNIPE